jgi:polar amino acid transport system substrate-binding protein
VFSFIVVLIILYVVIVPGCEQANNGNQLIKEGQLTIYRNRILVGTDATYPPFEFMEDGITKGFDMDIATEIAYRLDKEMQIIPITWDFTYKIPEDIRLDMIISAVSADAEKEEIVDFSDPYYIMEYLLITLSDAELVIKEDLKGKKVGMIDIRVKDLDTEYIQDFSIEEYKDILIMMEDLRSGNIDGVILSVPVGKNIIEENNGIYRVLEVTKSLRTFSMVFHKGSPLKDEVNRILEEMVKDGTYQLIYDRWFAFE